jgi:hypothetical protein
MNFVLLFSKAQIKINDFEKELKNLREDKEEKGSVFPWKTEEEMEIMP